MAASPPVTFSFKQNKTWRLKLFKCPWFPMGLENLENGKAFFSQGKVGEFCQDWKSQGILLRISEKKLDWKIEKKKKKTGKVRKSCQSEIVGTLQIWYHTLNLKRYFKKYRKTLINTGKVREICQSEKVGTMMPVFS